MRINHNISALNAWRSITQTQYAMSKTLERLSSGLRINRAGDDAAGLAISEKMRGQIKGLNMAIKNAQDAISLIQTAEGALTEVHSILQRMRELAVQASSDTNTDVDRAQIQKELDQLREEIDRIARTTEFNTKKLLDGKLESFRATADVKVVTGGNVNLAAQEVSTQRITVPTAELWATFALDTTLSDSSIYIDVDSSSTTVYESFNMGGYTVWVGFKSVGANTVRVVVYNGARGVNTIGHGTLGGDGKIYLDNIYGNKTISILGALSIDFGASMDTVLKIDLIDSTQYQFAQPYTPPSPVSFSSSYGGPTIVVVTPGGSNPTMYAHMNISGINFTIGAKSVGADSVEIFVWQGAAGTGTLGSATLNADGTFNLLDAIGTNTILDLTTIHIAFGTNKDTITGIRINGTAYYLPQDVADEVEVIDYDASVGLGGTATLSLNSDVYITVSLASVGNNSVQYIVKSYSGMTLAHGTIDRNSLYSNYALYTVKLADDLTVNLQFNNGVNMNTAYVYLTSSDYQANEGSYILEVGQFTGAVTSNVDYRIVKAGADGVTNVGVDELRRGFHFEEGTLFYWLPNEFTIEALGGSLPTEEVIDSAVARIEERNTDNNQLLFQIGANEGHNMIAGIDDMSARALGITTSSLNVSTQGKAERAVMVIDAAIHRVSTARAALGAIQNRLEHTIANLGVAAENLTAAESRIRDADMAKEMMNFTKQQILLQSSMAMLAQANMIPQNVLILMR